MIHSENRLAPRMVLIITNHEYRRKLEQTFQNFRIPIYYQCQGYGTAPSEMLDIFGLSGSGRLLTIGLLPKFLLEVSPFHGSIFFTSMGSLGIPPIVHHLYDFGNLPVFCAFGCKYRKNEIDLDGNLVQRKYVDFTVNTDERICDGFYFATALKHMKKYLQHPERLDEPLDEVVKDVD